MNAFHPLRLVRPPLRSLGVFGAVLLAFCVGLAQPAAAQPAKTDTTFSALWQVHLQQDGHGTDARGAQWLVLLGGLGGPDGVATAQDKVSWPADGNGVYRIDSTLTPRGLLAVLLRKLHWLRGASGEVRDGRPEMLWASDQRGDRPATHLRIEQGRMQVTTAGQAASAAAAPEQPAPPGLTDPLTLTWGFLQRPLPTRPFTVPLLINDEVQTAHITPQHTTLQWQGKDVACTLLDGRSEQSSATLRIWLRQSDGVPLQVILGMSDRYGLDVVQTLTANPEGLATLHRQGATLSP